VTLTAVNPDLSRQSDTQVALRGVTIAGASGTALTASDMHAHNTFENPDAVKTGPLSVSVNGEILNVSIPAASVIKLEITIG
jgi:alpha-N-arabinofuranosidase